MARSNPNSDSATDCRTCRHYFVTYEARWPHGCRAFDVKARRLPSFEVEASSGARCHGWEAKPGGDARAGRGAPPAAGSDSNPAGQGNPTSGFGRDWRA